MDTRSVNEERVLKVLKRWSTAREVSDKLSAPASALRKISSILRGLVYAKRIDSRHRKSGTTGRPPLEYREVKK